MLRKLGAAAAWIGMVTKIKNETRVGLRDDCRGNRNM
jgi:hypothetical protein